MSVGKVHLIAEILSHQIRDALVKQIISGELEPGSRLVETKLASLFGTSQAPVREALRELDNYGLVDIRPRRGTFVVPFVQQTLSESYVIRAALEEAATRVIMLEDAVPTALLEEDVAKMLRAAQSDNVDAVVAHTVSFHRHIIEASENELLRRTWEALHIESRARVVVAASPSSLDEVAQEHADMLTALAGGGIEAACREARDHQWQFSALSQVSGHRRNA